MVVFDTNFLVLLLQERFPPVIHPETREKVVDPKAKIGHLIGQLQAKRTKVLIPTPVLAEICTRFGSKVNEIVQILSQGYGFEFAPFDTRAAIEAGLAFHSAREQGDKKSGSAGSWQKVKFDRQIVAIAKVNNAAAVYSNDEDVRRWSEVLGIRGVAVWDLADPPPEQGSLPFEHQEDDEPDTGSGNTLEQ